MTAETSSSSVNIGDVDGGIHGAQIAGRDIIKNIIVVGQFLDFAKVEELLPEPAKLPDLVTVESNIDQALREHLDSDLAESINAVGEILGGILGEWRPKRSGVAFPFKRMLPDLAPKLIEQLKTLDYWDTFSETGFSAAYKTRYDVIWLEALNQLWSKYATDDKRFGLAEIDATQGFVLQPEASYRDVKLVYNPSEPHLSEFAKMSNKQFRVFMAGLVIDLIRLASVAANDVKFWQDLTKLISNED